MQNSMKKTKKHLTVAVTGGIGSGKSFFIEVLKEKGFSTLSCDQIAKDLFEKRTIKKKLKKLFPSAVTGKIFLNVDRKKISDIVFIDKDALARLNALTHPIIISETIKSAKKLKSPVFVEVPLLFEGNYTSLFDKTVVVVRDKNARIESVVSRSNLSYTEVVSRMNNQVDYDTIDLSEYIVINNDGSRESLESNLYQILQKIYE